jgi:hypothetical protein
MNDPKAILEDLKNAVLAYYGARILANECPKLLLDWSEENSEEAGKRMQDLYGTQDHMFALAETTDAHLAIAIRRYNYAQAKVSNHPDSFKSSGGNYVEIHKLFQEMYDRESEMFALVGIDYHGDKDDK